MRAILALLAVAMTAGNVSAQALHGAVGGSIAVTRVRSQLPTGTQELTGALFGGQGTLSVGRLLLELGYREGKVSLDTGSAGSRDVVEGRAMLGLRPVSWLTVEGGPHARAYVIAGATQRWVFWELRARGQGLFIGSAVNGYAELWRAVSSNVNVPERVDRAQGGEAGMIVRLWRTPLEARVAYRIDHAALGRGSRLETVDGLVVEVTLVRD